MQDYSALDKPVICDGILHGIDTNVKHDIHHISRYVCAKFRASISLRSVEILRGKKGQKYAPSGRRVARRLSGRRDS